MKKIINVLSILLCLIFISSSMVVSAKSVGSTHYEGYEYNSDDVSVPAPIGFVLDETIGTENLKLENKFGKFTNIIYDGTDNENPFILLNSDNTILKLDVNLKVISYLSDFRDENSNILNFDGVDIAVNKINGYYFIPYNSRVYVFSANGKLIKQITANDVGLSDFAPTKVLHCTDGFEDSFYVVSGSNCVVLDDEGNFVETINTEDNIIDLFYDASVGAVYYLTSKSIVNLMEGDITDLPLIIPQNATLTVDANGTFYISYLGSLYSYDGEQLTKVLSSGVRGIEYFSGQNYLAVLKDDDGFYVEIYSDGKFLKAVTDLHISLNSPSDMLFHNNEFYVLNSGNGCVIKLDDSCRTVIDIFDGITDENNQKVDFTGALGMWISEDTLYIADTENKRVVVADFKGKAKSIIYKPKELDSIDNQFDATKVVVDRYNNIYVIAQSINQGALVFSPNYEFKNFFGSNKVTGTMDAVINYIRRKFLNKEQRSSMLNYTPVTLTNFDIDEEGFVYMVTETQGYKRNTDFASLLKKMNYYGSNILGNEEQELKLGDLEWDRSFQVRTNTSFIDVDVSKDGWINLIDNGRKKIFQYSPDGELISVFSGMGKQYGMSTDPIAIESVGDNVFVLDREENCIDIYSPTEYVVALHEAFEFMDSADTELVVSKWNEVLNHNSNNTYAYFGLGVAYENAGQYKLAMENYKIANAKPQYSKAFREYRKEVISDNAIWISLLALLVFVATVFIIKGVSKLFILKEGQAYSAIETKKGMPVYVLFHPSDGFAQFRTRNVHSIAISLIIVGFFFIINVFEYFQTGFIFNNNNAVDYNLLMTIATTVGLYTLFVISNMAIATFLDGKGKFSYVLALTSYSMIPWMLVRVINVFLSNILSLEESAFITIVLIIGIIWSLLILIIGTTHVHEYTVMKTMISLVLTVVAMIIFGVLLLLLSSLLIQAWSTVKSVFNELLLR